jgi:hypothetical protein
VGTDEEVPLLILMALIGCGSSTPETPEPGAEAPEEGAPAKGAKGKKGKKGKGRKGKAGGGKPAPEKPGAVTCPEGVVVNASWEGEYPDPIAHVTEAVTMMGRREPCQRRAGIECVVPAGLYHPWSDGDHDADYKTVRSVDRYTVLQDTTIGSTDVAAGAEVSVVQYLAEGFCIFEVEGERIESMCPGVGDDGETFEKLEGATMEAKQLLQVACTGGTPTWIDVADLMKQSGVRAGKVLEYGKVGPAE